MARWRGARIAMERVVAGQPWVWSAAGSLLIWVVIGIISQRFTLASISINATLAAFLAMVALGQMLVITGGGGGIDLSVPYVITFSAYWTSGIMNGHSAATVPGLLAGIGVGLIVGLLNAAIVLGFGIPPIVATLASGFIVDSATNVYASKFPRSEPSPALADFVRGSLLGIPWMVVVAGVLALLVGGFLHRTVPGRHLEATGQSERAAWISGVRTWRIRTASYFASGGLAGLTGVLLSSYVGGGFLHMGDPYLLESIGAVVLGGSLIAGGKSSAAGSLGGALFLILVVTLMEVTKLDIGMQDVFQGLLIILVLVAASRQRAS